MLGQFSGEEQPNGSLNFPGGDGGPLIVVGQTGSFTSDSLKDIVHERVHDGHSLGGYTSVGVNLLQHLVDVDSVGLTPLLPLFLISLGDRFLSLTGLFGSFSRCLWRHDEGFRYYVGLKICEP